MKLESITRDGAVAVATMDSPDHAAVAAYYAKTYGGVLRMPCHAVDVTGQMTPKFALPDREYAIGMCQNRPDMLVQWRADKPQEYRIQNRIVGSSKDCFGPFLGALKNSDQE